MINLKNIKNQKINLTQFVEVLFYSFPISFIIGNLAVSLHSLVFAISSLILIRKEKLSDRSKNMYWFMAIFFLYLILSTTIQFQSSGYLNDSIQGWPLKSNPIFKSFLLIRYLLLFYIVNILIFNNILNLRKFFLSSLICTTFVSADVILQYFSGFDLFGNQSYGPKNPGPFGDELIAGSYLQKFSFFSFFYIFEIYKDKKIGNSLIALMIILHSVGIFLAGNRMSFLLYFFGCFLIMLLIKKIRFSMIIGLIFFMGIYFLIINNNPTMKYYNFSGLMRTINFFQPTNIIMKDKVWIENGKKKEGRIIEEKRTIFLRTTGHLSIFKTAFLMWKEQPLFGFGLKSFRIKCWNILERYDVNIEKKNRLNCSTHPHNYYLELLSESGIIGISLMIIFFLTILKRSFYIIRKNSQKTDSNIILLIPIAIIFFLEIWPLKSTGSFFTTWNATFFWLIASILFSTRYNNSFAK